MYSYEEMGKNLLWMKKLIFTNVFIQENRIHTVCDKENEISVKQWLLLAITTGFEEPQDLTSLAKIMGCSRQNVKKLASALEKSGHIELFKKHENGRSLYVRRTEKGEQFVARTEAYGSHIHECLFSEFTEEEIETYFRLSVKFNHGIDRLEENMGKKKDYSSESI